MEIKKILKEETQTEDNTQYEIIDDIKDKKGNVVGQGVTEVVRVDNLNRRVDALNKQISNLTELRDAEEEKIAAITALNK